jgi:hypothetical protein
MIERDHYFAAWAIEHGVPHEIKGGSVHLHIDMSARIRLKTEYASTHKQFFERVKKIIKDINQSRG